jgi:hypothetical protein
MKIKKRLNLNATISLAAVVFIILSFEGEPEYGSGGGSTECGV